MKKIIYAKSDINNTYNTGKSYLNINDNDALTKFMIIIMHGSINFLIESLKYDSGGYITPIYDISSWGDIYIIGAPMSILHGLREIDNKKISVNKKEFIVFLELWVKLTSEGFEEIILEKNDDTISLSGNGKKAYVHWAHFKYDWEDEDLEVYDLGHDEGNPDAEIYQHPRYDVRHQDHNCKDLLAKEEDVNNE